ncbi:glycosyltransferase [Microbacterium sp.]|uniref:glycosyltransferase n=1 Tax=Microbacterium sp. TaxID=51671 RepID=UPI0039E546AC
MTIDISLPFWGDPRMLFQTVASVQAQTDRDWRLRVIDDAYPDEAVPAWFAGLDDERISYVRNERNVGIIENFRTSIRLAEADHVVVLGSDDLLHPDFVAVAHRAIAAHPDADIIQPGVRVIDEHDDPVLPLADRVKRMLAPDTRAGAVRLHGEQLATSLVTGDWLYWPSLILRTDTVKAHDFRDDLPIALDLAILLDIVFDGGVLVAVPDVVFDYRRHTASASQQSLLDGRRFNDDRRFHGEIAARAKALGWRSTERAARWRLIGRLHALAESPHVLRHGTLDGRRALWRSILR